VIYTAIQLKEYGFSPDGRTAGITHKLEWFLRQGGCEQIERKTHTLNFSGGTKAWTDFYQNAQVWGQLCQPLLLSVGVVSQKEGNTLYQQMLLEMYAEDFCGVWFYLSVWDKG
jgi:hypothetical protein